MFADGISFVCFYDAERVLSAIANFLVHLLGKWQGRGGVGRKEIGEGRGGYEGAGNGNDL